MRVGGGGVGGCVYLTSMYVLQIDPKWRKMLGVHVELSPEISAT